jgi:hypothetical protein
MPPFVATEMIHLHYLHTNSKSITGWSLHPLVKFVKQCFQEVLNRDILWEQEKGGGLGKIWNGGN